MMFNNKMFNYRMIPGMHDQMTRLYKAALALHQIEGPSAIAKFLNVSPQTIHNWESRGISNDGLLKAQEMLGCNAIWIRDGKGDMATSAAVDQKVQPTKKQTYEIEIPQYNGTGGGMGGGVLLRDQPGEIQNWRVTPEWLSKNVRQHSGAVNLRIVTGFGDSMRPLFNPGDPLLVDAGVSTVEFDSIYFFRIGDEGFIKRLQRIPGQGLVAISENKAYKEWVVRPDMDFEVFGRVLKVWCGTEF